MPVLYVCDGIVPATAEIPERECREIQETRFGRDGEGRLRPAPPPGWRMVALLDDDTRLGLLCPSCGARWEAGREPKPARRKFGVLDGGKGSGGDER